MALEELGRFDRQEAHMVIGFLGSHGIDAVTFDGNSSIADGSFLLIPVRVMVENADIDRAQQLLDRLDRPSIG